MYGALRYTGNCWEIRCEPQVRTRLKRVFPRIAQFAAETQKLSHTPEHARELQWFLDRYPMTVSEADRERLELTAQRHVDQEQALARLLDGYVPPAGAGLAEPLRDYQHLPSAMLGVSGGLLLGDDVGLGKTVESIAAAIEPGRLPCVIVVPPNLTVQWVQAFGRFAPQLRVHRVKSSKPYPLIQGPRGRKADLWETLPDVIVLSYFWIRQWAEHLGEFSRMVVYDEVQQLRRPDSAIYRACEYLSNKVGFRLGLSATPILNMGGEIYWVYQCLAPDVLGERNEFVREWCGDLRGSDYQVKDTSALGTYLRSQGVFLRRTRAEVGRELPPVQRILHEIDIDLEAFNAIESDAIALSKIILAHNESFRGQRMQASAQLDLMMRQATGVSKAPFVAEFVRLLAESGEKIVVFGWHRDVYEILLERLADLKPVLYTGSESPTQKAAAAAAFIEGDAQVLIMSLRCAVGVDGLQHAASICVFAELDWSPGVITQNIGRLDRDEQDQHVTAYFLTSPEGSDPPMLDVLGLKTEQVEGFRNPGMGMAEKVVTGEREMRALARMFLEKRGIALPVDDGRALAA